MVLHSFSIVSVLRVCARSIGVALDPMGCTRAQSLMMTKSGTLSSLDGLKMSAWKMWRLSAHASGRKRVFRRIHFFDVSVAFAPVLWVSRSMTMVH